MMNSCGKTPLKIHAMGILWRISSTGVHASLVCVTTKKKEWSMSKLKVLDLKVWIFVYGVRIVKQKRVFVVIKIKDSV
jgi:hypothetical protein